MITQSNKRSLEELIKDLKQTFDDMPDNVQREVLCIYFESRGE